MSTDTQAARPAVVLLSGGIDSAVVLALASQQFDVYALTFDYGQRHLYEIKSAIWFAEHYKVRRHIVMDVPLSNFGGSALTGDAAIPKNRSFDEMSSGIPATYVPARNTVFLSLALAWAETIGARDIFIGANKDDFAGYPDCRPDYMRAFCELAKIGTGLDDLTIHAPLAAFCKADVVALGMNLGVQLAKSSSCYDPDAQGTPCQECDACQLRIRAFMKNGVPV